jgi:hypothetical protein
VGRRHVRHHLLHAEQRRVLHWGNNVDFKKHEKLQGGKRKC